ncbi:hybrid sensor histidine kinase/response regulator [Nostoc sp. 'Lobaria pulmonaria (5183) cyanobiont']|uniref:hybrid sensor histidine kinase/response regulator n=1 Tax=Nostoc sp. 'Lobaria pulmonaria (5183) cyanobiont' TaxID=1618022 RepID=UPI000CF343D8|nr:ATP-binding protein [Nostoc sp. 'Lobaria pulmonaria (5183) cyanobiont']AVH70961.1 histidine kinase [Nostoc sp. 'Lobaria pulmonaria (5183) cyanobiont']
MTNEEVEEICLDDILITEELSRRVPRTTDLKEENDALHTLVRQLVEQPQIMLKKLVKITTQLCQAESAGVSLLEVTPNGENICRWYTLAGMLEVYEQTPTLYSCSFCGFCLERQTPQLFSYPERYFTYLQEFKPTIVELLVVPLLIANQPLGTIWIVSHDQHRQFDQEDLRLMKSLANFTAAALYSSNARQAAEESARREQAARAVSEAAQNAAEQANRLKDEFLAVLSHELRSPLNPILGWAKLLQTRKFDEEKTAYALATIERNAKLQSQLMEDLLDVSRILQSKLSLKVSSVDLSAVIEVALDTVQLAAQAKSVQLKTKFEPNVGQILGDPSRLQQVVWNLLSNAVKFTPSEGQVEIRLERVGTQAQIQVSDTGKGIEPEFLPHVFDYFRQADNTTTRTFGGLGLGLAIVRQIVELHGGTVHAESEGDEKGATFIVLLPIKSVEPQTSEDKVLPESSPNLEGVNVLVVDDEVDTRDLIVFILQQYGATVRAFASASLALDAFALDKPDILLSDIGMPEMDGYMLIRQIRSLPPQQGGEISAIALTAYAGETNEQQILQAGFQKHLTKPIEPDKLALVIASLVK